MRRVDVSTDGGRTYKEAELQQPVLRHAHTRFRFPWKWNGEEAVLQSRCTDERGEVQPTIAEAAKNLGVTPEYFYEADHFNGIQPWKVSRDGSVHNALASSFLTATIALSTCVPALAQGPTYQLGRTPSAEEIKASDTAVSPDGKELPPGSGTASDGAKVFAQKCAACHGPDAMGTALARGLVPLGNTKPVKLEWSLVPYATTVWDFINRAMPQSKPGSLTADEVYAVTAFVLFRNGIIKEADVLDARSLPKIRMPNRDNFLPADPAKVSAKRPFGYYP